MGELAPLFYGHACTGRPQETQVKTRLFFFEEVVFYFGGVGFPFFLLWPFRYAGERFSFFLSSLSIEPAAVFLLEGKARFCVLLHFQLLFALCPQRPFSPQPPNIRPPKDKYTSFNLHHIVFLSPPPPYCSPLFCNCLRHFLFIFGPPGRCQLQITLSLIDPL